MVIQPDANYTTVLNKIKVWTTVFNSGSDSDNGDSTPVPIQFVLLKKLMKLLLVTHWTSILGFHSFQRLRKLTRKYSRFCPGCIWRASLWKVGLDYRHGTGHGVGAALNVHEGPQSISFRFGNMTPLLKGMIISNEPGYYEDHAFGIRIEATFEGSSGGGYSRTGVKDEARRRYARRLREELEEDMERVDFKSRFFIGFSRFSWAFEWF
ncbi:putative xaa-Pro aminopeptidase [Helianthus annuus]|nr:putative xaa-Pro aminopeptidase [Helianthus annuus]